MIIKTSPSLNITDLIGLRSIDPKHRVQTGDTVFKCGRDAIHRVIAQCIKLGVRQVLIPASICAAAIEPVAALEIPVVSYRLNTDLTPDVLDIESKLKGSSTAVITVQFFGFPVDLKPLRDLCDLQGSFLIEDCALSLYGQRGDQPVGSQGHASIFSWRKFLPVPDGGVLRINDDRLSPASIAPTAPRLLPSSTGRFVIKSLLSSVMLSRVSPKSQFLRWAIPTANVQEPFILDDDYSPSEGNSTLSNWLFNHMDHQRVIDSRRKNASHWFNWVAGRKDVTLVHSTLGEGDVPYGVPVLVHDAEQVVRFMEQHGVLIEAPLNRPYYESQILKNPDQRYPEIEDMAKRTILLPVHQSLKRHHVNRVSSLLDGILATNRS